jgi:hypothetical protein
VVGGPREHSLSCGTVAVAAGLMLTIAPLYTYCFSGLHVDVLLFPHSLTILMPVACQHAACY